MYVLNNKTILLISPQAWGKMFISKHHYAIELAKKGNIVYFLNPPKQDENAEKPFIDIQASAVQGNLFFINHKLAFPYKIKFHARFIFHLLMKRHVKKIKKRIGKKIDIVWSFDLGNLYPFSFFGKNVMNIFHPVDEPLNKTALRSGKGAHIIFSVTKEILKKYSFYKAPGFFINHGISDDFLNAQPCSKHKEGIHVGFAGNLLRTDIDRPTLLTIINQNQHIQFNFWGSAKPADDNLSSIADEQTPAFINQLAANKNVCLHGVVSPAVLATSIQCMDAFLICYDILKDQSHGTNYHKVMEFISTGKAIISNNITTYKALPNLVIMASSRINNDELPALFKSTILSLEKHNTQALMEYRKRYAMENTYCKQIESIEQLL